jgi:PAS fold
VQIDDSEDVANHTVPELCAVTSERVSVKELLAPRVARSPENADFYSELRRVETSLAVAQRLSQTGCFGWSVAAGKVYLSDETYNVFEHDQAAELTLETILRRIHPDDRDSVQQILGRASEARTNFDCEYRWLMPDGSVKHLHVVSHKGKAKVTAPQPSRTPRRTRGEVSFPSARRYPRAMSDNLLPFIPRPPRDQPALLKHRIICHAGSELLIIELSDTMRSLPPKSLIDFPKKPAGVRPIAPRRLHRFLQC